MIPRVLETEVMDTAAEADDYDAMDHAAVNRLFVDDFLAAAAAGPRGCSFPAPGEQAWEVLDLGTGTAQIPIELLGRPNLRGVTVTAVDMAAHMLRVASRNVAAAGLERGIRLQRADAKRLPCADGSFAAVMSNSIVHHIPQPGLALAEMLRVLRRPGLLFVRDLLRPDDVATVDRLVATYAGEANPHQRQMFRDSLCAALTLEEIRALVSGLGFPAECVAQTSDRHWTAAGWVGTE